MWDGERLDFKFEFLRLGRQVDDGDDRLLPDCRLPIREPTLQAGEDLVAGQLLAQVLGELVNLELFFFLFFKQFLNKVGEVKVCHES